MKANRILLILSFLIYAVIGSIPEVLRDSGHHVPSYGIDHVNTYETKFYQEYQNKQSTSVTSKRIYNNQAQDIHHHTPHGHNHAQDVHHQGQENHRNINFGLEQGGFSPNRYGSQPSTINTAHSNIHPINPYKPPVYTKNPQPSLVAGEILPPYPDNKKTLVPPRNIHSSPSLNYGQPLIPPYGNKPVYENPHEEMIYFPQYQYDGQYNNPSAYWQKNKKNQLHHETGVKFSGKVGLSIGGTSHERIW